MHGIDNGGNPYTAVIQLFLSVCIHTLLSATVYKHAYKKMQRIVINKKIQRTIRNNKYKGTPENNTPSTRHSASSPEHTKKFHQISDQCF